MSERARWLFDRTCRCDTGELLNPLMHLFLFITFVFGISYVFFADTEAVQSSILFQQTNEWGATVTNTWGIVAMLTLFLHTIGIIWRGPVGMQLMQFAMFGGIFIWLWAAIVYGQDHYWFQFFAGAVPNLCFWAWYVWQWRIRHRHMGDPTVRAFV